MAHVYWRIYITNAYTSLPRIAELTFYDASGSVISTAGGTASADSAMGGKPAANAFDNNPATEWEPNAYTPNWLEMQFASAVAVDHIAITTTSVSGDGFSGPIDFSLQYSDDGVSWTTPYTWKGVPWQTDGQVITFTASNAAPAPPAISWRLLITAAGGLATELPEWNLFDASGNPIDVTWYATTADSIGYTGVATQPGLVNLGVCNGNVWLTSLGAPSSGSPDWIQIDFPSIQRVGSFNIKSGTIWQHTPTAFELQYSYDGVTWTTVGSYTTPTWTNVCQTFSATLSPAEPGLVQPAAFVTT